MDNTARLLLDTCNLAGKYGYPQVVIDYKSGEDGLYTSGWYAFAVPTNPIHERGIHTKQGFAFPHHALVELKALIIEQHGS